ncbi:MAG: DUF2071 domain-containing protein [Thermoanaerobaculia bacterium]
MTHPAFAELSHRPWPVPERPWSWRQSWCDLLFAHWPLPVAALRPLVPPGLELQQFEGSAWIGVVPFRMEGVMRRPFPDLPWISAFPELNVRTYVEHQGRPGVWFLSLDATNPLAVWAARRYFHLPYHRAEMSLLEREGEILYRSQRQGAQFRARYRPTSEDYRAARGTLEHWLTERYCLYAQAPDGCLWRNEVHHIPWPLQRAEAEIEQNSMLECHGLAVSGPPAWLHFSRRIDVVVWGGERVG